MAEILVAHAPAAAARAELVVNKLEKLGFTVTPPPTPRRDLAAAIDRAQCVLVLWTKDAARTPGLRAAAAGAKNAGKLALARLDGAAPPPLIRIPAADLSRWAGHDAARNWRLLLNALPRSAPAAATTRAAAAPEKREGFVWLFLLGLAASAAAAAGAYAMLR